MAKKICEICGAEYDEDELIELDGKFMCEDCAHDEGYEQCSDCGEWVPSDDLIRVNDGDGYVCDCCIDNYYCCDGCGDYYSEEHIFTDDHGTCVCHACYEAEYTTCEDCGRITDDYEVINGYCYCRYCASDHECDDEDTGRHFGHLASQDCSYDNGDKIHNYGFKPRPDIKFRNNEPTIHHTIGAELEIDGGDWHNRESCADAILGVADGRVYLKNDGSLNSGFEIVSHPGSLAHHMYEMPWKGICSKATKFGFKSHDTSTCGLHIHVSRASLGNDTNEQDETVRKVKVLLTRFWAEVVRFTRRTEYHIDEWASMPTLPFTYRNDLTITPDMAERIPIANSHDSRYHALNCENEATIEFRIFRGTLKRDTIIASMQFCVNFVDYAKTHSWDEVQHSLWLDVAQYKRWNELDAYLAIRGLAPAAAPVQNTKHTPDFTGTDGITD